MKTLKDMKPGDTVTAKRYGWNEDFQDEKYNDWEPYSEKVYKSDDLSGVLTVNEVPANAAFGTAAYTQYLVGGQVADPKTIRPVG